MEATTYKITDDGKVEGLGEISIPNQSTVTNDDFDPESVLIQVLRRPTDPLNKMLEESLYSWVAAGIAVQPLRDAFGGWIDVSRNWQSWMFRKSPRKFKYQLIIDNDVGAPVDIPMRLARHDLPIVSAVVPAFNTEKKLFACIAVKGKDGRARFPTLNTTKVMPAEGLVEVHNCGTGCVMVRRDVVESMWEKHESEKARMAKAQAGVMALIAGEEIDPDERKEVMYLLRNWDYVHNELGAPFSIPQSLRDEAAKTGVMPRGEDICFTDRARSLGYKVYADLSARCVHDATMTLAWPPEALDHSLSVEDWMVSAFDPPVTEV